MPEPGAEPGTRAARGARAGSAALGAALFGGGAWVASHHPLAPTLAVALFAFWTAIALRWPNLWIGVLPAMLPLLNLSPWSGWIVVDEFDLAVCGACAAGCLRHAAAGTRATSSAGLAALPRPVLALAGSLGLVAAIGLWRGLSDAAPSAAGWYQSYADPLNTLRVGKSLVWALLMLPLLADALRFDRARAVRSLGAGVLAGLTVVCAAVLWERMAYTGLWDFAARYRTVALFWEMHVGGAAIDAYLALAAPFVAWALWRARSPLGWALAAGLALVTAYAALTTFSRGVYVSVAAPLLALGIWLTGQRFGFALWPWLARVAGAAGVGVLLGGVLSLVYDVWALPGVGIAALLQALVLVAARRGAGRPRWPHWRGRAGVALVTALLVEIVVVLGPGSYMTRRIATTERDVGSRMAHWQRGLRLVSQPLDLVFGIGLGRLPAHYAARGGRGEFPGTLTLVPATAGSPAFTRLAGPAHAQALADLFSLTQRVALQPAGAWRVGIDVRAARATELELSVCEMHLLYERRCQVAVLRVEPARDGSRNAWHHADVTLGGPLLDAGSPWTPRLGVFGVSVMRAGTAVDIGALSLRAAAGADELLRNGRFAQSFAHWFPSVQYDFLPWHIDNLYLELLIERGAFGLLAFAALVGWALTAPARARSEPMAAFAAASVAGALTVGLVSSVMDVPRVAFLLFLLAFFAILITFPPAGARKPVAMIPA